MQFNFFETGWGQTTLYMNSPLCLWQTGPQWKQPTCSYQLPHVHRIIGANLSIHKSQWNLIHPTQSILFYKEPSTAYSVMNLLTTPWLWIPYIPEHANIKWHFLEEPREDNERLSSARPGVCSYMQTMGLRTLGSSSESVVERPPRGIPTHARAATYVSACESIWVTVVCIFKAREWSCNLFHQHAPMVTLAKNAALLCRVWRKPRLFT